MGAGRTRAVLSRLGLVAGGLGVGLLLAEAGVRILWTPPEIRRPVRPSPPPGVPELQHDVDLARPNASGVYNGAPYHANRYGFRGRDLSPEKPPGVFRIVVAGDSVVMGSGVADDEAYPALLEALLNARAREGRRYEVLNLGLIGLDLRGILIRLERLAPAFSPDLVVYGCTLNDIKGLGFRNSATAAAFFAQQRAYNRFSRSPSHLLRVAWPHWLSLRDVLWPPPGTPLYEIRDNYFQNPPAWTAFEKHLDHLAGLGRTWHVPIVVFQHTALEYLNPLHPYRDVYARIAEAAERRGMRTVQSFDAFRGHDEVSLWVSAVDAHPNAAGHRLLAAALAAGLDQ
jgi:lysophospholipase L1-like esterase